MKEVFFSLGVRESRELRTWNRNVERLEVGQRAIL
jgi:hypothetical protein